MVFLSNFNSGGAQMRSEPRNRLWASLAVAAAAMSVATSVAHATTYYWDTNGSDTGSGAATGTWSSGSDANFTTSSTGVTSTTTATTASTDTLTFSAGSNGAAGTVTVAGAQTVGTLTVTQAGVIFTGDQVNAPNATFNASAEFDNALTSSRTTVKNGSVLTLKGGGSLNELDVNSAGGTVELAQGSFATGSPAWSGVSGGLLTLKVSGTASFANSGSSSLGYNGSADLVYTSSGDSTMTSMIMGRGGNATFSPQAGSVTASGTIYIGNKNATSDSVTVSGTGTLTAGAIALNAGAGGSAALTVAGGTLNADSISNTGTGPYSVTLSGGVVGVKSTTSGVTWAPNITLSGNAGIRAATAGGSDSNITLSGVLSGAGGLTKTGGGNLTLSNAANSYTGDTTVSQGTLTLANGAQLQFVIGANGVNNGITVSSGATLSLGGNFSIDTSGAVTDVGNSWTLISNAGTVNYLSTFALLGFTLDAGNASWSKAIAPDREYQFTNSTGILSVVAVPEPASLAGMAVVGALALTRRRKA